MKSRRLERGGTWNIYIYIWNFSGEATGKIYLWNQKGRWRAD
jgi:hypothetical protein